MSRNSEIASATKLIALERRYSRFLDDAWFLPLACWSLHLIYLRAAAATRIPITNFPHDIAFHHWKVLFSQELTSFPKNRAELRCQARDSAAAVVAVGGCMQFCKLELNLLRREKRADSILSRKMPRDGAGEMGFLTRRMKLLKRQRHVYLTMKAVTSVTRHGGEN